MGILDFFEDRDELLRVDGDLEDIMDIFLFNLNVEVVDHLEEIGQVSFGNEKRAYYD